MVGEDERFLVFRLGGNGFVLSLDDVVEVVDPIGDDLDYARNDPASGIIAALNFRCTWIPVVNPGLRLTLSPHCVSEARRAVVLEGSEGRWALLVDSIEELASAQALQSCEMSLLLQQVTAGLYHQLKLLNAEPLIVFEPELYYGSQRIPL
jgi:chemotaxis signal transduction protein